MNINKFGAFISYLSCLGNNKHFDTYEVETIAKYVEDLMPEVPKAGVVSCEAVDDLLRNIGVEGKKIEAIKAYRMLTGADLRTSKDAVEKYWNNQQPTAQLLSDILGGRK